MIQDLVDMATIEILKERQKVFDEALHVFQKFHRTARPIHTTDTRPADISDDYATWLDNQRAAIEREIKKIQRAK